MNEIRKTVCNRDCPDACSILAHVEEGRITRLQGDPDHPVTRGFLCYRTNQFLSTQYSPDRVVTPLVRKGHELAPASWDEALGRIAEKLSAVLRESGPAAIFHYRSGGSLGMLKMLSDYFFAKLGPVTQKRGDICSGAGDAAQMLDFGEEDSHDLFDLLHSKNIVLWGKNVFTSSPHLIPILREARERGAKLVLIDPVHHKTATLTDTYVQPRPAGDFALAMAVARVLFEGGWTDPRAASYCDHLDAFRAMAMAKSIDAWCTEADVTPGTAEDLARMLAEKPAAILVGWGMGRRANGAAIVRALDALGAISGNLGVQGGGVSFYFKRRGAFDTDFIAEAGAPPRTVCEPLFGREVLDAKDPPIRAVWITCGNPVTMLPESNTIAEALRTRELVVVVDSFLTDTARLAHVVLPTTTLLEADDVLGAYGHHYLGVARPVAIPPADVKSDLEILQMLADKLGDRALCDAIAGDARAWKARFVGKKLAAHGVTIDTLEKAPTRNPLAAKVLFEGATFKTESKRVNLITAPPAASGKADSRYPLWLLSLSTPDSQSSQWSRKLEGPALATVHPDAAAGIADGALAKLESRIGSMTVRVRHDPAQRRDVVIVPKGGHLAHGRCANALIAARTTDLGEGGALYDEHVRLAAVEAAVERD